MIMKKKKNPRNTVITVSNNTEYEILLHSAEKKTVSKSTKQIQQTSG